MGSRWRCFAIGHSQIGFMLPAQEEPSMKNTGTFTQEEWELLELEKMPEEEIDTDDIPEVLEVVEPRRGAYYELAPRPNVRTTT